MSQNSFYMCIHTCNSTLLMVFFLLCVSGRIFCPQIGFSFTELQTQISSQMIWGFFSPLQPLGKEDLINMMELWQILTNAIAELLAQQCFQHFYGTEKIKVILFYQDKSAACSKKNSNKRAHTVPMELMLLLMCFSVFSSGLQNASSIYKSVFSCFPLLQQVIVIIFPLISFTMNKILLGKDEQYDILINTS